MAYNSTSWSPDANAKASETSSETLNNATLSGTLTVTGATTLNSTLTIGSDGTGHDVTLYGDTSGRNVVWDESQNRLRANDNALITVGTDNDASFWHTGSETRIEVTGNLKISTTSGTLTLGNVSGQAVSIGHTTSETTVNDNLTVTGTVDIDDTTDSSSSTSGALKVDGGVGIAKKLYVGTDLVVEDDIRVKGNSIYFADASDCILSHMPNQGLKIAAITAQTDDMIPLLFIQHQTTATPVAGIGSSILFSVEAPAGVHQGMAIGTLISDATSGAEDFDFLVSLCDNGAIVSNAAPENTEKFRVTSDGKIRLQGNVIQASDGGNTITMDTSDNVTIAGNLTVTGNGVLVAKTYKPETFFAYNLASVVALSSGTEYYIPVGGNPFDFNTTTLQQEPASFLVQTALCDFTISRIAVNIYTAQANVTSVEIRLKKYDGSGNMDDKAQWATVGTVATIHNSSTLNADTRVVQTPSDWVIEKNEIWGLTLEYTISSGTVGDVQISGGLLMSQDWSDVIANT